ncbi:MAG: protein phosphatase 2C domain-containing protein [Caldimonas sp.]
MTYSSATSGLVTPLEPDRATDAGALPGEPGEAVHSNAFRRLAVAAASTCGTYHGVNEDAHSPLDGSDRLFVVADGVGGGAMARVASTLLVSHLHDVFADRVPDPEQVSAAILGADRMIAAAIARLTDRPGAATVALCAPVDRLAATWLVGWVGDCRVYHWSPATPATIGVLTRDDTFGHLGEAAPSGGSLDDPARMVGNGATSGANTALHAIGWGDVLAVCSDGVHKHLDDEAWCRVLAQPSPLVRKGRALVALARARGSADDATVLLVERSPPSGRGDRRVASANVLNRHRSQP